MRKIKQVVAVAFWLAVVLSIWTYHSWLPDPVLNSSGVGLGAKSRMESAENEWEASCFEIAQKTPEPYTPEYFHTGGPVETEGIQWAAYQHEGNITWEDFQRANSSTEHFLPHLKILDGRLYFRTVDRRSMKLRDISMMDAVLLALSWFDIPDMDFFFDEDDSILWPGGPIFQSCGNNSTGTLYDGFTVPYYVATKSCLGPTQMEVMNKCINERYPIENRIPKVVYRGTSWRTIGVKNESLAFPRAMAVTALAKEKEIADCEITMFAEESKGAECWLWDDTGHRGSCPKAAPKMPIEDFNKYALVLDADGRGWSGRIANLILGNTPILKQVPRYPDYLTHHYAAQDFVEFFDSNVSNIVQRVKEVLLERNKSPLEYHRKRAESMRKFARMHLTHFGIARAMAQALTIYAEKMTWKPVMEDGFVDVHHTKTELSNPSIPPELIRRIRSKAIQTQPVRL